MIKIAFVVYFAAFAAAEAGLLYGGYGYGAGPGYAGLGYYGKRSADAEPEAYERYNGGYGYAAPYGYGKPAPRPTYLPSTPYYAVNNAYTGVTGGAPTEPTMQELLNFINGPY